MISDDDSPLPGTEVHYLRSTLADEEFKIIVGTCSPPVTSTTPVLFVGDALGSMGTATEIVRLLHVCENIPALLVVGIGYRVSTTEATFEPRARDFTPTVDDRETDADPAMRGGAERFLSFVRDELKPWVRTRYGVDPDDSAFFGDSYGALFGAYTLLTEPSTFRRYGLGSLPLYYDHDLLFNREAAYADAHDDLPAQVYVSVGEYETPAGRRHFLDQLSPEARARGEAEDEEEARFYPSIDMVADAERFVSLLRSRDYPSLKIEFEILAGEFHETAPPTNLSRAVRYLFGAPR
jgi:predicted alpha/beta superfamily hydrolase